MAESPPTWREHLGHALDRVGEFIKTISEAPAPCSRCGQVYTYGLLLKTGMSLRSGPNYPAPTGIQLPYLCCPACAEVLKQAIDRQRRLEARNAALARENLIVWEQCERAREKGLEATLTLRQWLHIGTSFQWRCAYCPDGAYEALEHIIPIVRGGGTTAANCVPACKSCNSAKGGKHPDEIRETSRSPETIRRVRAQLQGLQATMPDRPAALPPNRGAMNGS